MSTFLPPGVAIFAKKPCFFALFTFLGCQTRRVFAITARIIAYSSFLVNKDCPYEGQTLYNAVMISIDDVYKLDIRLGTIILCESVPGSDKLLRLEVDFGDIGKRQILTGMANWYSPEDLIGLQTTFVVNLAGRKMMGLESQGMVFALGLSDDTKPVFLIPKDSMPNGEGVR